MVAIFSFHPKSCAWGCCSDHPTSVMLLLLLDKIKNERGLKLKVKLHLPQGFEFFTVYYGDSCAWYWKCVSTSLSYKTPPHTNLSFETILNIGYRKVMAKVKYDCQKQNVLLSEFFLLQIKLLSPFLLMLWDITHSLTLISLVHSGKLIIS